MEEFLTPKNVLMLASVLFCIGVYGVLARRNMLIIMMSLELMLVAVNVALVGFSRMQVADLPDGATYEMFRHAHTGQFFTLAVMTVAAGEVGIGLAIIVTLYRTWNSIEVDKVRELRG